MLDQSVTNVSKMEKSSQKYNFSIVNNLYVGNFFKDLNHYFELVEWLMGLKTPILIDEPVEYKEIYAKY